jgi:hypothetical protein
VRLLRSRSSVCEIDIVKSPVSDDWNWRAPAGWTAITAIYMHTGDEPLRVITGGLPKIEGTTVLEKRSYFGSITIFCVPA